MYVTAHRVHRGAVTGINTFLHLHGGSDSQIDWQYPDVRFVAEHCPGAFVVQRAEVPPGNNPVSSYLDVVAPDDIDGTQLLLSIGRARFTGAAGDVWHDGPVGYRFYCSPGCPSASEFELLRAHVGLMVHDAQKKFLLIHAHDPLVIEISNDDTGIRYRLDERSQHRIVQAYPHVIPASLGVFFEHRDSLLALWGEETYHFEIAKAVTGLDGPALSALGGVVFRDRYGNLTEPGVATRIAAGMLPGQMDGYWYGPGEEIPAQPPPWDPTGAILPHGDRALVLVPLEFHWYPVSDAAIYTYRHTIGLQNGEVWTFLTQGGPRFSVQLAESLPRVADVARMYGAEAASRARPDRPIVQVHLSPQPQPSSIA